MLAAAAPATEHSWHEPSYTGLNHSAPMGSRIDIASVAIPAAIVDISSIGLNAL